MGSPSSKKRPNPGGRLNNNFSSYFKVKPEDFTWQVVCTDIGKSDIPPHSPYPPNKDGHPAPFKSVATGRVLDEYQIIYVTRGGGSFETMGRRWQVSTGSMFFLFPGVEHSYRPNADTGWEEYWIGFKGSYIDALLQAGLISHGKPFFQIGYSPTVLQYYASIFEGVKETEPYYHFKVSALINMLIAEVLPHNHQGQPLSRAEQLVDQAKFVMAQYVGSSLTLKELWDRIGVSSSHIGAIFKDATGLTPYQYFIDLKIEKAKTLLEQRDEPIKRVAYDLGFEDPYYFSRLFSKKTGVAPSHWQRMASAGDADEPEA
jgi:AraC-like DNA-binding protein